MAQRSSVNRSVKARALVSSLALLASVSAASAARAQGTPPPAETNPPSTGTQTPAAGESTAPATTLPREPAKAAGSDATQPQEAKATAEQSIPAEAPKAEEEEKEPAHAVYLSGDITFTRVDMGAFKDDTSFDKTAANGLAYGLGVGYRLRGFRVGARFRANATTEFTLWNMMLEVGWGPNLRPIQPVFMLHGGYTFDTSIQRAVFASSLPEGNVLTPDADVKGGLVGVEVLASWWVTKFVRLAPFVGFDVNFLHRERVPVASSVYPALPETAELPLYSTTGSGIGYTFGAGLRATFDIGF